MSEPYRKRGGEWMPALLLIAFGAGAVCAELLHHFGAH